MSEIAQRAGVGIATLYRHFPTRGALIEEVYRQEVEKLTASGTALLDKLAPEDALEEWLKLAVDYIGTKRLVSSAIAATQVYGQAGQRVADTLFLLVRHARDAGRIRSDTQPEDVARALIGFTYGHDDADWQSSATRLIEILMRGLRR